MSEKSTDPPKKPVHKESPPKHPKPADPPSDSVGKSLEETIRKAVLDAIRKRRS